MLGVAAFAEVAFAALPVTSIGPVPIYLSITENFSSDTVLSLITTFNSGITENLSAADAELISAQMLFSIAENTNFADVESLSTQFVSSIFENIDVADNQGITAQFAAALTENMTADTVLSFIRVFTDSITENLTSAESEAIAAQFIAAVSENINIAESESITAQFVSSISEAIISNDVETISAQFATVITEDVAMNTAFVWSWILAITENVTSADTSTVLAQFVTSAIENINSADSSTQVSAFLQSIAENLNLADNTVVTGWIKIIDAQTANWTSINNLQTSNWNTINNLEVANWALINDLPTTTMAPYPIPYWYNSATNGTITLVVGVGTDLYGYIARNTGDPNWSVYAASDVVNIVVWSNGKFYISRATTTPYLASSTDGLTWTQLTTPVSLPVQAVCSSSIGLLAIAGSLPYMSYDNGATWTAGAATSLLSPQTIIWDGAKFILAGRNIYTSTDGLNWTSRLNPGTQVDRRFKLAWSGSLFVTTFADPLNNLIPYRSYTSPDGITWTNVTSTYGRSFNAVSYANGQFIFVAYSGTQSAYYTSVTGTTTPVLQGTIVGYRNQVYQQTYTVSYTGSNYVLPGYQTTLTNYFFYTSTNLSTFNNPSFLAPPWSTISNNQTVTWQNTNNLQ
jgi:hypothetical protein